MADATFQESPAWSRLAAHLEAAISKIPRPNLDVITDPKQMGKRLKQLCKSLKLQLSDLLHQSHLMSRRVYDLMKQLASKISDLISRFYDYISDKVKSFVKWISGLIQNVRARFEHLE